MYTRQSVVRAGDDPALASCAVQRTLCTEFIRSMAWRGWYPIGERFDDEGEAAVHTAILPVVLYERVQAAIAARKTRATTKAPRYYRCRTDGCDGGQIAATEVEDMVLDALRRPQWNWPDSAKQRLAQLASTWDVLWPQNRRRALADAFETMTWRSRTKRLLVRLRSEPSPEGPAAS